MVETTAHAIPEYGFPAAPTSQYVSADAPALPVTSWSTPSMPPPVFGDWSWTVTGLDPVPRKSLTIDFLAALGPSWGLIAKEVLYWRYRGHDELRDRITVGRVRKRRRKVSVKSGTIAVGIQTFGVLRRAAEELSIGLPGQWSPNDTDALRLWLTENEPLYLGRCAITVLDLHEFRDVLTLGGIAHDPMHGRSIKSWGDRRGDSNAVKGVAVPPTVFAPLMKEVLAYLEDFSDDILKAMVWRDERIARWSSGVVPAMPTVSAPDSPARAAGFRSEINWLLDTFIKERGGLPANLTSFGPNRMGEVSWITLAAMLDVRSPSSVQNNVPSRNFVLQSIESGVPLRFDLLPLPVSSVTYADGSTGPWRRGWCWTSIFDEVQNLRYACMTAILAFTGMRISELETLPITGWRTTWFGHPAVTSRLVKTSNGDDAKWWATDAVVKACELLEATAPSGADRLCSSFAESAAYIAEVGGVTPARNALNAFIEHINTSETLLGRRVIPARWRVGTRSSSDGERITPHMLRFTLAAIGNTAALGDVALKTQFQHATHAMTWSYMNNGGAEDWKNVLVEGHATYGQETVTAMIADIWAGEDSPSGSAGRKVERMARSLMSERNVPEYDSESPSDHYEQFRGVVADEPTLLAFIQSVNRDLHFGTITHCYDDPAKRQCAPADADAPLMAMCFPEHCGNALVAPDQRPVMVALLSDIETALGARRVPERQRNLLEVRRSRITNQLRTLSDDEEEGVL